MDIAHCLMIDDTGNVKQCVDDRANIMCELSLAAADKQLCLDKTIGLPLITLEDSTEIEMQVSKAIMFLAAPYKFENK